MGKHCLQSSIYRKNDLWNICWYYFISIHSSLGCCKNSLANAAKNKSRKTTNKRTKVPFKNIFSLMYRGYSKTFLKIVCSSSLFFPLYHEFSEQINTKFNSSQKKSSVVPTMVAATASGTLATIIMHPADFLKTRHVYNLPYFMGFNPKFYYKGLSVNLLRVVPHFNLVMIGIEQLKQNGF
jgi:hypothetical protein